MKKILFVALLSLYCAVSFSQRISDLPPASVIYDPDLMVIVQSGVTKNITYDLFKSSLAADQFWADDVNDIYNINSGYVIVKGMMKFSPFPPASTKVNKVLSISPEGVVEYLDHIQIDPPAVMDGFGGSTDPVPSYGLLAMSLDDSTMYRIPPAEFTADAAWVDSATSSLNMDNHNIYNVDSSSVTNQIADSSFVNIESVDTLTVLGELLAVDQLYLDNGGTVAVGKNAGVNDDGTANRNTFIGYDCGTSVITANYCVAVGYNAFSATSSVGTYDTYIGYSAGSGPGGGSSNVFVGDYAGMNTADEQENTGVGSRCMQGCDGNYNTAIGGHAAYSADGDYGVYIGYKAGYDVTSGTHLYIANNEDNNAFEHTWFYGDVNYNCSVPNGSLTIGGALIMNSEAYYEAIISNASSLGSTTIDWSAGNIQSYTNSENSSFIFASPSGPNHLTLMITHAANLNTYTITWPASVKWPGGYAPTLTQTSGAVDIVSFLYDGTYYYGMPGANFQ